MIRIVLALLLFATPAFADSILLLGAGGKKPSAAPSYSGPGDVVSGATFWGSCARVYNLAAASTSTSLCDLVAVTGGATVCTLRGSSTGFVDLAASYCAGTTPAAACAAASGGSCKISKMYDQTGNGNHLEQATLSQMPALTFSAIGSLPCATFTRANSQALNGSATLTIAQPVTISAVSNRNADTTLEQSILGGSSGGLVHAGYSGSANTGNIYAGSVGTWTVSDSTNIAYGAVINGTSSVGVTNGSGTAVSVGTNDFVTSANLNLGRVSGFHHFSGYICEAGIWGSAFNATQYGNMSTNQRGASNGYNF